jgi:hypothetical protein
MAKGPLRLALEDFLKTSPPGEWILDYRDDIRARQEEIFALRDRVFPIDSFKEVVWTVYYLVAGPIYVWTGWRVMYELLEATAGPTTIDQGKASLQALLHDTFSNPQMAGIAELIGSLVTDPVLNILEEQSGNDISDPKDFARRFHGIMTSLTLAGAVADATAQAASAGAIKAVGSMVQSIYWNLGLGFLGWQTLAPLLSSGLQPGLNRYYLRKYRPNRFSAGELRDLYALGEISSTYFQDEARTLGWRDEDIGKWVKLAFRNLSEADVWQAWHEKRIDLSQAAERLRALGYDPGDIPLLFQLNPMPPEPEAKETSAGTARASYRKGLISASSLRVMLEALDYNQQEINLIIQLEDLQAEAARKDLTVNQIKDAWTQNVLTDVEARHWLTEAGFALEQINLLIQTWQAEAVPEFLKVNSGTVTGAYVEHIYNRTQAATKLMSIGYTQEDATLQLDLAELRNPDAFNPPAPPPPKLLTPGVLSELVFYGLLTPEGMRSRLVDLGYTEADAVLLSEAARIRAIPGVKVLPQASIANAYLAGVIGRGTAIGRLEALGYDETAAEIVIATLEAQNPELFGAPPEVRFKQLSEGTLVDLTLAGLLTLDQLRDRLAELNYTPTDIELVIARVEQLQAPLVRVLTQSTIERAYIVGVLTREGAFDKLLSIQFTAEDANQILDTVELENPAVFNPVTVQAVRLPTIGALVMAVQNGLLTEDEFMARAAEIGYSPEDALLYLALGTKTVNKPTVQLTPAQVVSAYGHGFYTFGRAQALLTTRGYNDGDASILLRIQKDLIQNTEAWFGMLNGDLTFGDTLTQLINAKYADQDILDAFRSLPPATLVALGVDLTELQNFLGAYPGGQ